MLTKKQVLHLSLALVKAGDVDLANGNDLFVGKGIDGSDVEKVREIVKIVHTLCQEYRYENSLGFDVEIAAKSADFVAMKKKIESSPVKRLERLDRLYSGIRVSIEDPGLLKGLVQKNHLPLVDRFGELLISLRIPS